VLDRAPGRRGRWVARWLARWAPPIGAVGVAVGAALPWAASGRRRLSGYDLAGVARTFGLAERGGLRWAVAAWFTVPLLAALAVALTVLGARRAALVPAALVVVAGLGVTIWVVREAQGSAYLGTVVTFAFAVLGHAGLLVGAVRTMRVRRRI
jgi:hypothetical protein